MRRVAFETEYEQVGSAQFCVTNCDLLHGYLKLLAQQEGTLDALESAANNGAGFVTGTEIKGLLSLLSRLGAREGEQLTFASYREAERKLLDYVGGEEKVTLDVPGFANARRIDVLSGGVAVESKVGYVSLDSDVRSQIERDAALAASGGSVTDVVWVFGRSGQTGRIGASNGVLNLLDKYGIKYTTFDDFYPAR